MKRLLACLGFAALTAACGCSGSDLEPGNSSAQGGSGATPGQGSAGQGAGGINEPDAATQDVVVSDPDKPPNGFLDPSSDDYVTLEFKGLINSQKTYEEDPSNLVDGVGELHVNYRGKSLTITAADQAFARELSYPDDDPEPALRGKHFVYVEADQMSPDSTSTRGSMVAVLFWLNRNDLSALGPSDRILDSGARATVLDYEYAVRKDSTPLTKQCALALKAPSDQGKTFIDHSNNNAYTAGENLIVWANASLLSDPKKLAAIYESATLYKGQPCYCAVNGDDFDCANWDEEVSKTDPGLSCGEPEGFLNPSGDVYAVFRTKGVINADTTTSPKPAFVTGTAAASGQTIPLESGTLSALLDRGQDMVTLDFLGNVQVSSDHLSFDRLLMVFPTQLLAEAHQQKQPWVHLEDEAAVFALLMHGDSYGNQSNSPSRLCPKAVLRPSENPGSIYGCFDKNQSFAIGETLEIEGNLPMFTDVKSEEVGIPLDPDGCACWDGHDNQVDCSTLPQ
jgi:hypothetical protein